MTKLLQPKAAFLQMLLIFGVLISPMWLSASTDGSDAVAKLQKLRASQNEQVKIANMKANSVEVKKSSQTPGEAYTRIKQESVKRKVSDFSKGIHRITPKLEATNAHPVIASVPAPLQYGSGTLQNVPGLEYFNFLSGMNSIDSIGMDVRHTTNELNNFGNEYASWGDPSLLYWYSPAGTLSDVSSVAPINDPIQPWATVSWDFTPGGAGNNGSSIHVGELWVVYARTSHMYTVMEITGIDSAAGNPVGFSFDYMIQTDGTTDFTDGSAETDTVDILVNGLDADTMAIGSEPYISINLGPDMDGSFVISWDQNHNGITDETDVPIEEYYFMDNDMHDLNDSVGVFEFLYDSDMADGLNYIADDFVYTVYTASGMADVAVTYYADPTDFMVTGTVRNIASSDSLEGVIVWGDLMDMTMGPMPQDDGPTMIAITDADGQYTLYFPAAGFARIGTWDHLMTTGGLIPDPAHEDINLISSAVVNFYYREPLTSIRGFVTNDSGMPLVDVEVMAFSEYMEGSDGDDGDDGGGEDGFYGYTDETGYYEIGVDPGFFYVQVNGWDLTPDYMVSLGHVLEATETGANSADFVLLTPNSSISGTVTLDGEPYPDADVFAWSWNFGWNMVMTDAGGNYTVPVFKTSDPLFAATGYELEVDLYDKGMANPITQVSYNYVDNDSLPAFDELIELATINGGLYGTFYNNADNMPIMNTFDLGIQAMETTTGEWFGTGVNPMDGTYQLWLPDGEYEVMAGGMDWYGPPPDTILISGTMDPYDLYLDAVNFEGIFEGRVLDEITNAPIADAQVNIGNEHWGNSAMTDPDGYFHFDLPNGYYGFQVFAHGYLDFYGDVDINNDYKYIEVKLTELVINGAIAGIVSDGVDPVQDAMVHVWNPATDFGFGTMTGPNGEYWFDLPNGIYEIYVEHPNFLPYWDAGLWVSNDTLYYDVVMAVADGAIEGNVYDNDSGMPIMDAGVWVMNTSTMDSMGFWSNVDEYGYFYIPLSNGTYEVHVDAMGYEHAFQSGVVVDSNVNGGLVTLNFPLMKRQYMGPQIHHIMDQPNDQGRWVRMEFGPDGDFGEYVAYSVWRMSETPMGPMYDFIAYVPNRYESFYNLVAPTLIDSNAFNTNEPWKYETMFVVTGHYDDWNFVDGGPMRGWSVDNIHPGVPGGLSLAGTGDNFNQLQWQASADEDFQYFELYRSETSDFSGLAPVAQVAELGYRDDGVVSGQEYYYMLKSVDANGNVSEGSTVLVAVVSVVGGDQLPSQYSLAQNYPNPFNPTTIIEFALPAASDISLEVFNIRGQKVRTLVNGYTSAGYLSVTWDGLDQNGTLLGSGTYIYRLRSADITVTKKMVFMK